MKKRILTPMADVPAIRNEIGKTALGMLSPLLLGLLSWGAVQIWDTKLNVGTFSDHLAKDAMHDKIDSIHAARVDRQIAQLRCAAKAATCRPHNGR